MHFLAISLITSQYSFHPSHWHQPAIPTLLPPVTLGVRQFWLGQAPVGIACVGISCAGIAACVYPSHKGA